jgi:hypothetical protein
MLNNTAIWIAEEPSRHYISTAPSHKKQDIIYPESYSAEDDEDEAGYTSLHRAVLLGDETLVRLLLANGAASGYLKLDQEKFFMKESTGCIKIKLYALQPWS